MIYGTILMRGAVVAKLIERQTCNPSLWVRISAQAGIVVGGVNNEHSLHLQYPDWGVTLEQGTEPPTALQATALALAGCALGWVKCRAQISLMVIFCIIVYVTNDKIFSSNANFIPNILCILNTHN